MTLLHFVSPPLSPPLLVRHCCRRKSLASFDSSEWQTPPPLPNLPIASPSPLPPPPSPHPDSQCRRLCPSRVLRRRLFRQCHILGEQSQALWPSSDVRRLPLLPPSAHLWWLLPAAGRAIGSVQANTDAGRRCRRLGQLSTAVGPVPILNCIV